MAEGGAAAPPPPGEKFRLGNFAKILLRFQRKELAGQPARGEGGGSPLESSKAMTWIGRVARASAWALPAVAFTDYVGTVEPVRDESMAPSLRAECSEYVWVDKFWCNRRWVAAAPGGQLDRSLRGQIVYAKSPLVADEYVMKRVVGLPGDWVSVPRPGSSSSTELEDGDWETKSKRVHVGQGQLWVESDNRDHAASSDAEFVSGLVRTISPGFLLHIQPSDADSSTSLSLFRLRRSRSGWCKGRSRG